MSSGIKSWGLAKKLKETHLSNPFGRHQVQPSSSSSQNSSSGGTQSALRPDSPGPGGVADSRANTLVASDLATPRATVSANTAGYGVSGGSSHTSASSQSVQTVPAADTSVERPAVDTNTNPALLRVKVSEMHDLKVAKDVQALLPQWAQEKGSTRPPPVYLVLEYDKTQIVLHAIGGTVKNPIWDKTSAFDLSALGPPLGIQLYVCVYDAPAPSEDRDPVLAGTSSSSSSLTSADKSRQIRDVQVGSARLAVPHSARDPPREVQVHLGGGKLAVSVEVHNTRNQPLSIDDFTLLKVVGKGSFGKVMQVRKNDTRQIYALKTIRKAHIVSRSEVGHTLAERTVLAKINNPFIVPLKFSFQSPEKLYLVLAFVNGGELFHHLQREGRFDLNRARFYTAELLCALECLHEYNVIYRDLKPENILLDYTGHIALCDFGLCKLNMNAQEKTNTFCGTPEYLAPELLLGLGYTKAVDWWTLGVLFYEMLTGLPPFYDQDTNTMYHKIVQDPLTFPSDMDREAKSLLQGLLDREPKKRLGANGAAEIKAHPFFRQIDWKYLLNKKYAAPFQPSVVSATDTSNFDQEFTSEVPTDSVVGNDSLLTESVQKQFGGWSYTNDSRLASSAGRW